MDSPASPRAIDRAIAEIRGESISLDATPDKLQTGKESKNQSPQEIILERTREVGRLRAELAYLQEMRRLGDYLCDELEYVIDRLHMAVIGFNKGRKMVEKAEESDIMNLP